MSYYRRPPWQRLGHRVKRASTLRITTRVWVHWRFAFLWLQQHIYRPLPPPRRLRSDLQHDTNPSFPLMKPWVSYWPGIKLSPFHVHFDTPSVPAGRDEGVTEHYLHVVDSVQSTLDRMAVSPPDLLALHVQPLKIILQFAEVPLLQGSEQRSVIQDLQAKGFRAKWSDVTRLDVCQKSSTLVDRLQDTETATMCWIPVLRNRQSVVWWPLDENQHLVFVGAVLAPLTAFIRRVQQLPRTERPEVVVYDPGDYLRTLDVEFALLPHHQNALAKARGAQLAHRFAVMQGRAISYRPPICIVVAPDESAWPDLQPLLAPDSGVRVLLVFPYRSPIAFLRAACHHLWVIESPDLQHPGLPDAFRPSAVPPARHGQALAWSPGGKHVWRGFLMHEQATFPPADAYKDYVK